ncbi:MAG: alpha/beta fold hydrolase [Spirochaetia bacterium]
MKTVRLLFLSGVVLLLVSCGGPLYDPGTAGTGEAVTAPLAPPVQDDDEFWQVEDDIQLYYFSHGSGRPVLVVHGFALNPPTSPWPGNRELDEQFEFFYYHQRGCGYSTRPVDSFESSNFYENMNAMNARLGIEQQLADIERIRRILGEEKLIIIGHSYGGFLASLFAAEFPEKVEKIVLIAPANVVSMPQDEPGLYEQVREGLPASMRNDYDDYLERYFDYTSIFEHSEESLRLLNLEFLPYYEAAALGAGMRYSSEDIDPELAGGWIIHGYNFSLGQHYDLGPFLENIQAPALILQGTEDLQGEAALSGYLDYISVARLEMIPGAGHMLHSGSPEAYAQHLQAFLSEGN